MFDSKKCPFCKKDNKCQVDRAKNCWCVNIKVPQELKDLVPQELKMKGCICKNCIEFFKLDRKLFESIYLK